MIAPLSKIKINFFLEDRVDGVTNKVAQLLKNERGCEMAKLSKKKTLELLEVARDEERSRIKKMLTDDELFTPSIEPLIENYLDAFVIYKKMYDEWKEKGFPPTTLHENKAGAINEMKHPLAQYVETWNDRKNKMLDALGMTNKRKIAPKAEKSGEKSTKIQSIDKLQDHRDKWRNSG